MRTPLCDAQIGHIAVAGPPLKAKRRLVVGDQRRFSLTASSSAGASFRRTADAAQGYDKLNNEARLFWSAERWQEETDLVLTSKLRKLIDRKYVVNSGSPQITGWAYQKAKIRH